ncbi:MAG: hypothetical protein LBI28_05190 [Treponema sp.]|jgi:hypothetical protein|nr:hypothetical protein [Treponema sp.]
MLRRFISFYKKNDNKLAGEIPVNIDINTLQKKYNNEIDPMMFHVYPVKPEDADFFLQFIDSDKFDFLNFDYFLECCKE